MPLDPVLIVLQKATFLTPSLRKERVARRNSDCSPLAQSRLVGEAEARQSHFNSRHTFSLFPFTITFHSLLSNRLPHSAVKQKNSAGYALRSFPFYSVFQNLFIQLGNARLNRRFRNRFCNRFVRSLIVRVRQNIIRTEFFVRNASRNPARSRHHHFHIHRARAHVQRAAEQSGEYEYVVDLMLSWSR